MIKGIISYDISIDRYRNKLSRILSNYCTRIQYSVYQFELDEKIYKDMLKK
ncbi:CRISPR-associated endonuclease Cas2 [Caloramator sp. Dgby_cultured_2]|nr:CRISPR-associated endonuclease Cas2 [Caloramator sp. Dgby_cultured_2]WDU82964.1 CRISPR-associated endonuclease Cas2 [Caloramator sp. Dgby_cultured_2]